MVLAAAMIAGARKVRCVFSRGEGDALCSEGGAQL